MEKEYRHNKGNIVTLSVRDLDDLIYQASYRAARRTEQELFSGLIPIFNRLFDENEMVLEKLDYLKTGNYIIHSKEKNEEVEQTNNKNNNTTGNRRLAELANKLFNESPEKLTLTKDMLKNMEQSMKLNQFVKVPEINIPEIIKGD